MTRSRLVLFVSVLVVALGVVAGVYLDRGPLVLIALIVLGIVAGIASAYRIIKPYLE